MPIMKALFGQAKKLVQCVRYLVAEGADLNTRSANLQFTALHHSAESTCLESAETLIGLGDNVKLQDKYARVPLHIIYGMEHGITAEREGMLDVVHKAKPESSWITE
jgi:ankyrin repeat protein